MKGVQPSPTVTKHRHPHGRSGCTSRSTGEDAEATLKCFEVKIYSKKAKKPGEATPSRKPKKSRKKRLCADKVSLKTKIKEVSNSISSTEPTNNPVSTLGNSTNVPISIKSNKGTNSRKMSSTEIQNKSREDVIASRKSKKLAKQKVKNKSSNESKDLLTTVTTEIQNKAAVTNLDVKSKDEVDKAGFKETQEIGDKTRDQIKAERAAKKAAKQSKKKGADEIAVKVENKEDENEDKIVSKESRPDPVVKEEVEKDLTVKDVANTLKDIVNVAKEVREVTAKVQSIKLGHEKKSEETGKSKAELRAERRAKQEAQRAAKKENIKEKVAAPKEEVKPIVEKVKEEKSTKPKQIEKAKTKSQLANRINWFQHLGTEQDKDSLTNMPINSNLHPAIVKLGVQLYSRVVKGSNARCIALLDALKKMLRDYTLPAKTEFARGLEAHLAASLEFLWKQRQPCASQTNAVKFFRHHLTQLPNNVDEFDAKKILQEEIDRYIREQIDMAAEAISITVRKKISNGDTILTYGCSCLIERIVREAWEAGLRFHTIVAGNRLNGDAPEMLRRLTAHKLPCTYVDITALQSFMSQVNKVIVGASALLANGSVLAAAGTAQCALVARAHNVPVLVACETHKFTDRMQTDAFVYNEIGDPDQLIDKNDDHSPLKDWRNNPNLTPLNLTYDVTPASLVTAVVTELAILPCTSAPVVLRFKLSEYGI